MAAVLAREHVAKALKPGSHGTTFGGSPLACAVGNAVLDVILADGFLDQMNETASYLRAGLERLIARHGDVFTELRGQGLLIGLKCAVPNGEAQAQALRQGLLTVAAGDNVLRLLPPLVVTRADCDEALAMLEKTAAALAPQVAK